MKTIMRTIVLACFCVMTLCLEDAYANNPKTAPCYSPNMDNLPAGYKKIDIRGKLNFNAGPNGIEAGASDHAVYIHFNENYGNVSISICNAAGNLVYHSILDTAVQTTIIIPISNTSNGNFTLMLDNVTGSADGDFDHN